MIWIANLGLRPMAEIQIRCFSCQTELKFQDSVSRREECPKCRADVRVCKNCQFYDPKVYNECRETSAEVIREKERSNLCDFYRPRTLGGSVEDAQAKARAAAEALFKK
jgi:hypothetical protein